MENLVSVIEINRLRIAAILVDAEQTYPEPGAQMISVSQLYFPTLPIILLSPRVGGFSRSFAHFDTTNIIQHINTDEIDWRRAVRPIESVKTPF